MDQVVQQNAAMVEESTAASHGMAREAISLTELIGQFKLQDDAARPLEVHATQARVVQLVATSQEKAQADWAEF